MGAEASHGGDYLLSTSQLWVPAKKDKGARVRPKIRVLICPELLRTVSFPKRHSPVYPELYQVDIFSKILHVKTTF